MKWEYSLAGIPITWVYALQGNGTPVAHTLKVDDQLPNHYIYLSCQNTESK